MKNILKSGASLDVSIADIRTGFRLFSRVVAEFKKNGVDIEIYFTPKNGFDIKKMLEDKENRNFLVEGFLDVVTSEELLNLLLDCGKSAVYEKNGKQQRVTLATFEEEENRGDFFEVMKLILLKNIKPFFPEALTDF